VIIGASLVIAGIILLSNPYQIDSRIGVTLLLAGFFIIMLIPIERKYVITEKKVHNHLRNMVISLIMFIWIFLMFFITSVTDLEIFLILVIIGILSILYILEEFVDTLYKRRMKAIFFLFFIVFILVVGQKILNILNM
jgi:hypothetical protein